MSGVTVPGDRDMTWKDLWKADMGVVMRDYFFKDDVDGSKYGHLPKMTVSRALRRTSRDRWDAFTRSSPKPEQIHNRSHTKSRAAPFGPVPCGQNNAKNAPETTAAGVAPEKTCHSHARPLTDCDALAIEWLSKKRGDKRQKSYGTL